jgi:PPP family 3-phenylpropionic acid transporter
MSAGYIACFYGTGTLLPFLPVWLRDQGFAAAEIAIILGTPLFMRVAATHAFAYFGDRLGERRTLQVLVATSLAAALVLPAVAGFWPTVVAVGICYVFWQSAPLQMDALTIGMIRSGRIANYGSIRAFGSAASFCAGLSGGVILGSIGSSGILVAFYICAFALLTFSLTLPAGHAARSQPASPATAGWRRPNVVAVMIAAAFVLGCHSSFTNFGALYMHDLGFRSELIGLILALSTAAEFTMFAFGSRYIKKLDPVVLIAICAFTACLRWIVFSFLESPIPMIMLQGAHALTFAGTVLGLNGFTVANVDPRHVVRVQGIYVSMFAATQGFLTVVIGNVYDALRGHSFLITACLPVLSLIILGVRWRLMAKGTGQG